MWAWERAGLLRQAQEALLEGVERASARSTTWARSDQFRQACAQVRELPGVPVIEEPGLPPEHDADMPEDPSAACAAVAVHCELVVRASRDFNRCVLGTFKRSFPEEVLADDPVEDAWFEDFLTWISPFLTDGCGLYLWA